ncbi:uncharacterized protein TNCV_2969221 [Trichonephila clavipes]|nr:uncharacterized protein TNCV_2969221 [Trichonephila clavipes]
MATQKQYLPQLRLSLIPKKAPTLPKAGMKVAKAACPSQTSVSLSSMGATAGEVSIGRFSSSSKCCYPKFGRGVRAWDGIKLPSRGTTERVDTTRGTQIHSVFPIVSIVRVRLRLNGICVMTVNIMQPLPFIFV